MRQLKDIVAVLADADLEDKRAMYDELGVNLTYYPDGRVIRSERNRELPVARIERRDVVERLLSQEVHP